MSESVALLVTIVLLCWAMATHPRTARCPTAWYVDGVRPSGLYECRPALDDVVPQNDAAVRGLIYCTGGARPIVTGPRTVGCQR